MKDVDWTSFSAVFDLFLDYNPVYLEVLEAFLAEARAWPARPGMRVADLGAGTGNFSIAACRLWPDAIVHHVEPDAGMRGRARSKAIGLPNLHVVESDIAGFRAEPGSLSVIISVHVLYALSDPRGTLSAMFHWLEPGGRAFLVDLGRVVDMGDWMRFFVAHLVRELGIVEAARLLWRGREIARQNRIIRARQLDGSYWTHSTPEFADAVRQAGFRVLREEPCNRGVSDLVVAEKPA
jgi:SAM-dependent methyltransferase